MGRYYYAGKFSGKFGFGVQSSSDPEYFGMYREDVIRYYLSDYVEEMDNVKHIIDEQYDILELPLEDRVYEFDSNEAIDEYESEVLIPIAFRPATEEEINDKNINKFYDPRGSCVEAKQEQSYLALCRIRLGLCIYNELRINGECTLEAEC